MIYGTLSFPTYALINSVQECKPNVRFEHKIIEISCGKSKDVWPGAALRCQWLVQEGTCERNPKHLVGFVADENAM